MLALTGPALAQQNPWEQRVLRDRQVTRASGAEYVDGPLLGEGEQGFDSIRLDPVPDGTMDAAEPIVPSERIPRSSANPMDSRGGCQSCGLPYDDSRGIACDDECGCGFPDYGTCGPRRGVGLFDRLLDRFSLFAGVQGFKGPVDQGRNGNFGFHEGFNFGAPLGGPWGIGYQLGARAVHGNFSGDQVARASRDDRNQFFLTGGFFRRAVDGGLQWGVVFDALHDRYYETADLTQLRAEISWVGFDPDEVGFWASMGTKNDQVAGVSWETTDLYAIFYRRHFSGGGEGRLWGGFTNKSDALVGGDFRVPMGNSWALENSFNYLIPKEPRGLQGLREESWGVTLQLVWYPGRSAACVGHDPFQPVLNVADNSVFMVDYVH